MGTLGRVNPNRPRWDTDARETPPPAQGTLVTARPVSMRKSFTGTVVDTDGPTVVLRTSTGMLIAVHLLDCCPVT